MLIDLRIYTCFIILFYCLYVETEREDNNNNGSQVVHAVTRSPDEALDEIKTQQTHNLYCPICKSNITADAELFKKDQEPDPYRVQPFVLWVPLVVPFKLPTFHLSWSFLAGKPFTYI